MCFARSSADVKSPTDVFYFIAAHQASLSNLLLEFLVIGAKPAPTRAADFQGLIFLASGHEQPGKNNVIYLEEVRGLSWASAPLCSWREHKCRALCLPCSCFQHVELVEGGMREQTTPGRCGMILLKQLEGARGV